MKNILLPALLSFICFMIIPAAGFSTVSNGQSGSVEWSVVQSWKLDAKPIDLAHSLDKKKVFILGDDGRIHVYSAEGDPQGSIDVGQGVTAIDIAPQGEQVYLINEKEQTFTSLDVSYTVDIDVSSSPFLGNENAPVVLAVFSDFQ